MDLDFSKCVVCKQDTKNGRFRIEREEVKEKDIPCCKECHESDRFRAWWDKAVIEIHNLTLGFAFEKDFFTGNPWIDIDKLRVWKLQDQRIEDGVCPNGCALMVALGDNTGDWECPVCKFQYHHRTLS